VQFDGVIARGERIIRSPVLGAVLVLGSVGFVVARWRSADWSVFADARLTLLAGAGAVYVVGVLALATAAAGRFDLAVWPRALESQLFKYIPGGVWQSQPLVEHGGIGLAGRFAWATLLGAALAVVGGGTGWVRVLAAVGVAALVAGLAHWLSVAAAAWGLVFACLAAVAIGASGGLVAGALGSDVPGSARAVAAAWGVGVAAVPVPGGLGVREAALTVILGDDAAPIAATHRLITLVSDATLGFTAMVYTRRRRRGPTVAATDDEPVS
jgi:hypothetical protein